MRLTKGIPRERRPGYERALRVSYQCDECGKLRSVGNHAACSRKRQERHAKENHT